MSFGKIVIKKRKNFWITVAFIILMSVVTETRFDFSVVAEKVVLSVVASYGVLLYLRSSKQNIATMIYRKLLYAAFPFMLAFVYTVIISSIINQYNLAIIPQAFTSMCFAYIQLLFAGALILIYRGEAISIVYYYIVGSYTLTITRALMENSITDIITKYNSIYNALERNDIGTAVAPVIILYMYLMIQGKEKNKLYLRRIIIMSVIMLLCGKRSAMVAIGVALIVFWVLSLNIKDKLKFCYLLSMFTMGVLYVFVVAVKTGVLEWICLKIGISTQGRVYVWSWFDDQYNLSPFYMGKGFQYVHKYMEAYIAERGVITSMVSNFGYLHNSILQIFIELGFAGFFLWFVFYLIFYPNNLRKIFGVNTYYLCVILMVCNVWMYMTDNTLTYPIYQSTLYIALFSYVFFEKKTRSGDAIRNDDVNHCCSV